MGQHRLLVGAGFAVWFAIGLSRRVALLAWLGRAAGVGLVLVLVIAPFASRYLATSHEVIMVNGSFGVRQTADNLFRHVVANLVTGVPPIDAVTSRAAQSIATALSLDTYRLDTTAPVKHPLTQPPVGLSIFHEDYSQNLFHNPNPNRFRGDSSSVAATGAGS